MPTQMQPMQMQPMPSRPMLANQPAPPARWPTGPTTQPRPTAPPATAQAQAPPPPREPSVVRGVAAEERPLAMPSPEALRIRLPGQ